jgi:hypothetical protein
MHTLYCCKNDEVICDSDSEEQFVSDDSDIEATDDLLEDSDNSAPSDQRRQG